MFLRWISPFYIFCGVCLLLAAAIRGFGDSRTPAAAIIGFYVVFRQAFLYYITTFHVYQIGHLVAAYNASWVLCSGVLALYYRRISRRQQPEENLQKMDNVR